MPELKIRELRKSDYKKAIQSAIKGMHFNWYMDNKWILNLYGRYFWYLELTRATQVLAAYHGDEFAGVLLCEIKGESKKYKSWWNSLYVKVFDCMQKLLVKDGVGPYDEANRQMLEEYKKQHTPDGEILFLAANPDISVKGIGSMLLSELEKREHGKEVYLFTDSACTYQFYEHRGFERIQEKDIVVEIGAKKVDLECYLYCKMLGS